MKTILSGVVGSTAYGLATPESDIDTLSIHLADTNRFLGFGLDRKQETVVTTDPDSTSHELGKYCRLALQCNPTALEAMWLPEYTVLDWVGVELIRLNRSFLSEQRVKDAYIGYAMQQATRLLQRTEEGKEGFGSVPVNRVAKHARHCVRLLLQARNLLATADVRVRLSDAEIQTVRDASELALKSPADFYSAVKSLAGRIEKQKSILADKPEQTAIESWLIHVRRQHL